MGLALRRGSAFVLASGQRRVADLRSRFGPSSKFPGPGLRRL